MNKKKRSLFFVQSPMQLMNAIEAKHFFSLDYSVLIVRYNGSASNNAQIGTILKYDPKFDKILYVKVANIVAYFKFLILFKELILYRFDKFFLGDFHSNIVRFFLKFINPKKVYLLDDGLQTVAIHRDNLKHNIFSYYNLTNNSARRQVYSNQFDFFRSYTHVGNRITIPKLYFIGAPLVEKEVLTLDVFLDLMGRIVKYYEKQNIEIIYLPHRMENLDKFKNTDISSFIELDIPIELFLIESEYLPFKIASFYSAALYSLNVLFKNKIEVTSFGIPYDYVYDGFKDTLKACYGFYEKEFEVIYPPYN